ncbi:MAG: flavin reductase family protein [Euryarchaeota archaeon]|nr:flavin reductase family protein [Euryarchaeota archaeon]
MSNKIEMNTVRAIRTFPSFPIALVVVGKEEKNIITVSLVHIFSFNPPLVGIGISPCRYSHELLHRYPDFTVNIPSKDLVEETLYCGVKSGKEVDKLEETGLTAISGQRVEAPTLEECPVCFECRKVQNFDTGDHTWFIGEIVSAYVDESYDRERALIYWAGEFRTIGELIRSR